ncbi:hypothetical protein L484_027953 [Morus notabilis]|uniref:Uncharacterized protein n=1 Tax=Morus notabilis TaxID=981085 RepID=W9SW47_9ROSA|nr:hypothetical protein L484_027953 [Morus notabilis]
MAEYREALLKQEERIHYDENCPGCKIDRLKRSNSGIPLKHLLCAFTVCLAADSFLRDMSTDSDVLASHSRAPGRLAFSTSSGAGKMRRLGILKTYRFPHGIRAKHLITGKIKLPPCQAHPA